MLERVFRRLGYYSERDATRWFKPEAAAFQFYCQYIGPGDVVLEAGAYRGYTTVGLLVNIARYAYAFEPNPENFRGLAENTRGLERTLRIFNLGLGDHEWVAEMRGEGSYSSFVFHDSPRWKNARVVTLDSLNLDPSPTVLILDCEGMEVEAIGGAKKTIAQSVHSVLVETHQLGARNTEPEVKDSLSLLGFEDIQTRQSGWTRPWKTDELRDTWVLARRTGGA